MCCLWLWFATRYVVFDCGLLLDMLYWAVVYYYMCCLWLWFVTRCVVLGCDLLLDVLYWAMVCY